MPPSSTPLPSSSPENIISLHQSETVAHQRRYRSQAYRDIIATISYKMNVFLGNTTTNFKFIHLLRIQLKFTFVYSGIKQTPLIYAHTHTHLSFSIAIQQFLFLSHSILWRYSVWCGALSQRQTRQRKEWNSIWRNVDKLLLLLLFSIFQKYTIYLINCVNVTITHTTQSEIGMEFSSESNFQMFCNLNPMGIFKRCSIA